MTTTTFGRDWTRSEPATAEQSAPFYRLFVRIVRRVLFRRFRREALRMLVSMPDYIRYDIGVPDHSIHETATGLAQRKLDAWMHDVMGIRAADETR